MYWSIAFLYALGGAAASFTLWAAMFGLDPTTTAGQAVIVAGLFSLPLLRIVAGVMAKPYLATHDLHASDRNAFHGLWMSFWMLGLLLGALPLIVPR